MMAIEVIAATRRRESAIARSRGPPRPATSGRDAYETVCEDGPVKPLLTVIGGLPGTGKSTVAAGVAGVTRTAFLRVDRIEQTIVDWSAIDHPVGPVGYAVAHQLATEQLRLGLDVIVECVNPSSLTRDAWVQTSVAAGSSILEVELVCSDRAEHRRRIEARMSDVEGLTKPNWDQVLSREYEAWLRPRTVMDTAAMSAEAAVGEIAGMIESAHARGTGSEPTNEHS